MALCAGPEIKRSRAWGITAAAVVSLALPASSSRAAPSCPYSLTEHGGTDANGDGTTGASRPANRPVGGYTVSTAQFPPGDCTHCHDQHASLSGVSHSPNSALAFSVPENQLCATCHDQPNTPSFSLPWFAGWAGTQRTLTYGKTKHGKPAGGAQWVAGNPYGGIANCRNNNQSTPAPVPGTGRAHDAGSCLACHSSHGFYPGSGATALASAAEQAVGILRHMLGRTMGTQTGASPAESNALCNYCHDNTALFGGGDHALSSKSYSYKGSTGVGSIYPGYQASPHRTSTHALNLWPGSTRYPARTGEKGQCLNCHDPHGGAPAGFLNGAPGAAAPSNRMLLAPMIEPDSPTTRNTLCVTCHDNITGTGAQRFLGQAAYQAGKHGSSPAAYWGRTTDVYNNSATSYNESTAYWGPRGSGDYGLCLNCHDPHTQTVGTATVNGTQTIPRLLRDHYNAGNSSSSGGYSAENSRLCFDCHNESRLTGSGSRFPEHDLHIQGEGALCNDCHNPHGYSSTQVFGTPPPGARHISFNTATCTPSSSLAIDNQSTTGPAWFYNATVNGTSGRYGCLLRCHGQNHSPETYTPGGNAAQLVQLNYRWYYDGGGDASLVAGANVNAALPQAQLRGLYRLRLQVGEANNVAASPYLKLQYSANGGSTWADVGAQGAAGVPWRYANSSGATDGTAVGSLLLPATPLAPVKGTYEEAMPTAQIASIRNQSYEFDFVIEPVSGQMAPSTAYQFRAVSTSSTGSTATALQRYDRYPSLTTASGSKGYFEGTEGVRVFSDSAYATELYPQFALVAAGSTAYVEVTTASDGVGTRTVAVRDSANVQVAGPATLARTGSAAPYTYRAAITLPSTSDQQYSLDINITGSSTFRAGGPLLTVGTTTPTYYFSLFADSSYQSLAESSAPGDVVYCELGSGTDGTPSLADSAWEMRDWQGSRLAGSAPDSVSRVAAGRYRMAFLMPPLSEGYWYSLQPVIRSASGTVLAQGPVRLIKQSLARETRARAPQRISAAPIHRVSASPQPTRGASTTRIALHFDGPPPPAGAQYQYALDTSTAAARPVSPSTQAASARDRQARVSFDLPAAGWAPRSSHAVFVRAAGRQDAWAGTMVSVTPPDAAPVCVTYYLDEACTQPVPTPDGTPLLPRRGTVYLRLDAPDVAGCRICIDAPGTTNDVESGALHALSPAQAVAGWVITEDTDTLGRARIAVAAPGGRPVAPSAGAYAFVGEAPRSSAYFEMGATPETIDADGKATARVTATVTDANGQPLPSRAVDFRRTAGGGSLLPQSLTTDGAGIARALYLAGVTAETAVIQVVDRSSGASDTTSVRLRLTGSAAITLTDPAAAAMAAGSRLARRLGAPEQLHVVLSAYPRRLPADGLSTANLVALVTDARGNPRSGVLLRFEVADNNGQVVALRPLTDSSGRADAIYIAGRTPGNVTLIASDPASQASGVARLTLAGNGPAKVVVQASPGGVPADGRSLSQITVRVTDLLGRPVTGAEVRLRLHAGNGVLALGERTTNSIGEVVAVYRSGQTPGIETVTATVVSPLLGSAGEGYGGRSRAREMGSGEGQESGGGLWQSSDGASPFGTGSALPGTGSMVGGDGGVPWAFRLLSPVKRLLNDLSVGFTHWEDFSSVRGPEIDRSLHLSTNSWSIGLKRPMPLRFGGLSVLLNVDNNGSAQFGFVNRSTEATMQVRLTRRYYDILAHLIRTDNDTEDLRTNTTMRGNASSSLVSLTLRPPNLPVLSVSRHTGTFRGGSDGVSYAFGFARTYLSAYKQFGPFGLRWSGTVADQDQAVAAGPGRNTLRSSDLGLTLTQNLLPGVGLDFTLARAGSRTDSFGRSRTTGQVNSNLALRLALSPSLVVTGSRASDDLDDTDLADGRLASASRSVDVAFQPLRFLTLQAATRSEGRSAAAGGSRLSSRSLGAGLMLTPYSTLTFSRTHSEEPAALRQDQQSDSDALQLMTARILPGTDLLLGWTRFRALSSLGMSDINTYSARVQANLVEGLRATAGVSRSGMDGFNESLGFGLTSRTRELGLMWSPGRATDLSYSLTRLSQRGQDTTSDSLVHLLRLSTSLRGRAHLMVEAANNRLDQAVLLPGLPGQSLRGLRLSAQLNYSLGLNSYLTMQLHNTNDDVSRLRTRSLRVGYGTGF